MKMEAFNKAKDLLAQIKDVERVRSRWKVAAEDGYRSSDLASYVPGFDPSAFTWSARTDRTSTLEPPQVPACLQVFAKLALEACDELEAALRAQIEAL